MARTSPYWSPGLLAGDSEGKPASTVVVLCADGPAVPAFARQILEVQLLQSYNNSPGGLCAGQDPEVPGLAPVQWYQTIP